MFKSLLYLLLFFIVPGLRAQEPLEYSFNHFSTNDGLGSNEVTNIKQDNRGFIWIGTNNGIQRYDGIRYKTFRSDPNNPNAIPNNYIFQMLLDHKQNLWILTGDGKVGIFDTKTFKYREIKVIVKDPLTLRIERRLTEDEQGHLYINFYNNDFVTFNENTGTFSSAYNFIPIPAAAKVIYVKQQPGTKKYWISTQNGFLIYNLETKNLNYPGKNPDKEMALERIGKQPYPANTYFDKQGRVWFTSWFSSPAIFCYDLQANKTVLFKYFLPFADSYHEIRGYVQQKDGTVWIKGLGVFAKYDEHDKNFHEISNVSLSDRSIHYSGITDLLEDGEMNLWVASDNNGLYRFNPAAQFFRNVTHIDRLTGKLGKSSVLSFIENDRHELITGNWTDGLFRYDTNYKVLPTRFHGFDEKRTPLTWDFAYSPWP